MAVKLQLVSEWPMSPNLVEIHKHSTSGIEPKRTNKILALMVCKTYDGNYVAKLMLKIVLTDFKKDIKGVAY